MRDYLVASIMAACCAYPLAYLLSGCPTPRPVEPDVVIIPRDGGPADGDCARACEKLRELDCPEGKQLDGGKSCEDLCELARLDSRRPPLRAECVKDAKSKGDLGACNVRCR